MHLREANEEARRRSFSSLVKATVSLKRTRLPRGRKRRIVTGRERRLSSDILI